MMEECNHIFKHNHLGIPFEKSTCWKCGKTREYETSFEEWLRSVCFQKPTKEAYDLALAAWRESSGLSEGGKNGDI
jgi:hypothetical protein